MNIQYYNVVAKTEQELVDYLKSGESGGVTRLPTGEFAVPFCININVGKHPTKEQVEQALKAAIESLVE